MACIHNLLAVGEKCIHGVTAWGFEAWECVHAQMMRSGGLITVYVTSRTMLEDTN